MKSVCLVSPGLNNENLLLQPWRYLYEVGRQLDQLGYAVTLISDGGKIVQRESLNGLPIRRLHDVHVFPILPAEALESVLNEIDPDLVLLHVGLTSFLHQGFRLWRRRPTIGIFTSPLYTPAQMLRIGLARLWHERSLTVIHLLGALAPRWLLRRNMQRSGLLGLVVLTQTTRQQLVKQGLWQKRIEVIPPGVDEVWSNLNPEEALHKRQSLGYTSKDIVVGYFGSPTTLRGLPLLIRAVDQARRKLPSIKLLVLSRRHPDEMKRESYRLQRELNVGGREKYIHVVDSFLTQDDLVQYVACCNLVALPFELVPSDAPLSLLEVKALGVPLVTTDIACLPELASGSIHYLVPPSNTNELADSLLRFVNDKSAHDFTCTNQAVKWRTMGEHWEKIINNL